jgi:hypothetical protein
MRGSHRQCPDRHCRQSQCVPELDAAETPSPYHQEWHSSEPKSTDYKNLCVTKSTAHEILAAACRACVAAINNVEIATADDRNASQNLTPLKLRRRITRSGMRPNQSPRTIKIGACKTRSGIRPNQSPRTIKIGACKTRNGMRPNQSPRTIKNRSL